MIRMVITDLDNTLLRSDRTISKYTVSILTKCQANGIKVIFATARSIQAASKFFNTFVPDIFIGYGGALAIEGDEVISRFDIPADVSYKLINECLCEPEITNVHAVNQSIAFTNRTDTLHPESPHYRYTDFAVENGLSYLKISLVAENPDVVRRIASNYSMCNMLRYSGEDLYAFANRDAVKWNAVKAVATYCDISTDTIVAFGDDINDLEMLEKCGVGIAVENAVDKVKAVADYICGSNDNDGVAHWLEEHIFP